MNLILNGQPVSAPEGTTLLEVARREGFYVPSFCHNEKLKPFASCFVCAVEVEGRRALVPACSTVITEGMVVNTENNRVKSARKTCLELLLSDHFGDCLGPCMTACPAGIDIPGFISLIAAGDDVAALELIQNNMPLAGCLGRVCTRPCETACRRQLVEEPIAICQLKRFAADQAGERIPAKRPASGKTIAIVGAGPAGLSAAFYLQLMGHQCTVFDAHENPGGMIRYGIPSYRLPRDVIDSEVDVIKKLGAKFCFNQKLGRDISFKQLRDIFDAVFLGLGAQTASLMRTPGEELAGVESGIKFLERISRDEHQTVGKRVIVVGGGNTAIDAARTALRLGAGDVRILYRRAREQMPAWNEEIEAALAEGITLEPLAAPVKIEPSGSGLKLTCIRMELGAPDASGRRSPVPVQNSEFEIQADTVITAIGQTVDASAVPELETTKWRSILANEKTGETSVAGVFAGGDCVTGADIAVNAVAAGRHAAFAIDQYLRGEPVSGAPEYYNHTMGELHEIPAAVFDRFEKSPRIPMPHLDTEKRTKTFEEVETGFTVEQARAEARRCMECGCRDARDCALRSCATVCDVDASRYAGARREYRRDDSHAVVVYEEHKCIQCGNCVRACDELLDSPCMGFAGRGFSARVKPALDRQLVLINDEHLPDIVKFCPVGALTLKTDPVPALKPMEFLEQDLNH
ncbi:MAG: FAD-dependent oxidoreductase [Kiritimatiellales bacterium]